MPDYCQIIDFSDISLHVFVIYRLKLARLPANSSGAAHKGDIRSSGYDGEINDLAHRHAAATSLDHLISYEDYAHAHIEDELSRGKQGLNSCYPGAPVCSP